MPRLWSSRSQVRANQLGCGRVLGASRSIKEKRVPGLERKRRTPSREKCETGALSFSAHSEPGTLPGLPTRSSVYPFEMAGTTPCETSLPPVLAAAESGDFSVRGFRTFSSASPGAWTASTSPFGECSRGETSGPGRVGSSSSWAQAGARTEKCKDGVRAVLPLGLVPRVSYRTDRGSRRVTLCGSANFSFCD